MEALKMEICTHENLLEIDQTTGYTAVANEVMMHIITNPNIASASRLWILIRFQQSGFYDREYIQRTVTWFAKKLSVSISTIQKWQRLLEREGYLEIIEQKYSSKNNKPNQYRACLPKNKINEIKNASIIYTEYTSENTRKNGLSGKPTVIAHSKKSEKKALIKEDSQKREQTIPSNIVSILPKSIFTNEPKWFLDMLPGLKVEIIEEALWISGVHTFARKIIEKKGPDIVEYFSDQGHSVSHIKYNRQDKESFKSIDIRSDKVDLTQGQEKPTLSKQKVFTHTRHKIYKRLLATSTSGAPIQANQAKTLCEEVIYAIEEGSLKHRSKLLGINIALKLIRENRWTTPTGFSTAGSHL